MAANRITVNASIAQLNSDWEGTLEELPSECDDFVGSLSFHRVFQVV